MFETTGFFPAVEDETVMYVVVPGYLPVFTITCVITELRTWNPNYGPV